MKTKIFVFWTFLLFLFGCSQPTSLSGYWEGWMKMGGKTVDISVVFNNNLSTLSSRDLMLLDRPAVVLKEDDTTLSFMADLETTFRYDGIHENDTISGTVAMQNGLPGLKFGFLLKKKSDKSPTKNYSIENVLIENGEVLLSAEIYKPETSGRHPALLILHGTTTNLKRNYTFYADWLANQGFEVMLFDKRGNGASTGDYIAATYDDFVADAIACLEELKKRPSVDKTKIGVWGFSQGATLLPLLAAKTNIPSFLIAVSPEVFSISQAAAYADSLRIVKAGNLPANGHIAAEAHRQVEKMIREGSKHRKVENFINLNAFKHTFMNQTGLYGNIDIDKQAYEGYYWGGRKTDFYPFWKSLPIKALVIFGEDDELLDANKNAKTLADLHNPKITLRQFAWANHEMKKTFNPAKYPDFDWPRVADGYLAAVREWIEENVK
ncbi:MAG: alpha/beta fold hydrolase [Clostridia bacterium]|nr:alpha/beta fold hydrolase [Clostridia bacterium]